MEIKLASMANGPCFELNPRSFLKNRGLTKERRKYTVLNLLSNLYWRMPRVNDLTGLFTYPNMLQESQHVMAARSVSPECHAYSMAQDNIAHSGAHIPCHLVLLDNQSTVHMFVNRDLVKIVRP